MKPAKHEIMWCVLYANGARRYFYTEENARAEAFLYGIGLTAPLWGEL